jgi:hypothetical protein
VEHFDSGAVRDSQEGKAKFELITPTFKKDLADLLTSKAAHYGDRNWEKGIPTARSFSSLLRHVEALGRGEWLDAESGHPHTVLAAANLMFIHELHDTEYDTLDELVGPALRRGGSKGDYAAAFPTGSLRDDRESDTNIVWPVGSLIHRNNTEPSRDTVWEDSDGVEWGFMPRPALESEPGWCVENGRGWNWDDISEQYFPMVRVS